MVEYCCDSICEEATRSMSEGVPTISTCVGAIAEIIEQGLNGFLIEHRNPLALAEKIIQLIENRTLLKTIGENNKKMVRDKYDLAPVAKKSLTKCTIS